MEWCTGVDNNEKDLIAEYNSRCPKINMLVWYWESGIVFFNVVLNLDCDKIFIRIVFYRFEYKAWNVDDEFYE